MDNDISKERERLIREVPLKHIGDSVLNDIVYEVDNNIENKIYLQKIYNSLSALIDIFEIIVVISHKEDESLEKVFAQKCYDFAKYLNKDELFHLKLRLYLTKATLSLGEFYTKFVEKKEEERDLKEVIRFNENLEYLTDNHEAFKKISDNILSILKE